MALRSDEKARLAHRALRLHEQGFQHDDLDELAELARRSVDLEDPAPTRPVLRLARGLQDAVEEDRPGPTDEAYVADLLAMSWEERFEAWQKNADEACKRIDPEGYEAALASIEKDIALREELDAQMAETGEWPPREDYVHHGAAMLRRGTAGLEDTGGLANALYDLARQGFLDGSIDWDTASIKAIAVDTGLYTVDLATHQFVSSIAAGARVATSGALGSKTVAAGVADAADAVYLGLAGSSVEAFALMQSSAVGGGGDVADTSQRLIGFLDSGTGIPFTPNGGDLTVQWDNGATRIFKL